MQHMDLQSIQGYTGRQQHGFCFDKLHLIHKARGCKDLLVPQAWELLKIQSLLQLFCNLNFDIKKNLKL